MTVGYYVSSGNNEYYYAPAIVVAYDPYARRVVVLGSDDGRVHVFESDHADVRPWDEVTAITDNPATV